MDNNVHSGIVFSYNNRGSPLVKVNRKVTAIDGYTTAHKTPVGDIAEFLITESRDRINLANILNETPSNTIGTVSSISHSGHSVMDYAGKIILLSGYLFPPKIGTDIEYRVVVQAPNFDVAWIVDKDNPIGKTIEFMIQKVDILRLVSSSEKEFLVQNIKDIGESYIKGYPEFALMGIESVYQTMANRIVGKNQYDVGRYEIANGFKFIKKMIYENFSLK